MPYGDYTDLTARQRVAALKALLNLVLSAEDVHERIAQRAEAYHSQRRTAKDAPPTAAAPAASPDGQPAPPPAPVAPPRGAKTVWDGFAKRYRQRWRDKHGSLDVVHQPDVAQRPNVVVTLTT